MFDDVANIETDAKEKAFAGCRAGVAIGHGALDVEGCAGGIDGTRKLGQDGVAGGIEDATAVCRHPVFEYSLRVDKPTQCPLLVGGDKAAVARHIGGKDGCDLSVHIEGRGGNLLRFATEV